MKNSYLLFLTVLVPAGMMAATSDAANTTSRVFDPNQLKENHRFWVDAEALFWQSSMNGLNYAVKSNSPSQVTHGCVKQPDFKWDYGVRLGLGYRLPHDQWDLLLEYTYVHAHATGSVHKTHGAVFPSWAVDFAFAGSSFYAQHAKAHWDAHLNMGDLELGRVCLVGNWLTLRPFFGVRGLVLDQDYHIKYSGGTAFPTGKGKLHLDNDFWGVGVRFGVDSLWGLGGGWGIYGNGSLALLSGHFDVHEKEKLEPTDVFMFRIKRDVDNVVATADLALGLQWDYFFCDHLRHFGMKLGWEFNLFFDQNQFFNFTSLANPGSINFQDEDLSFQGITLGFRFDF